MNVEQLTSKINSLELTILMMLEKQNEFYDQALMKLSINNKEYYSRDEAAEFLNLEPDYIYQLVHQGRLKKVDNPNNKKLYFRKSDLIDYITGKSEIKSETIEEEILNNWNKKSR
ncbi:MULTISPECIES: helix-turn-helix domain-containing protein [Empedobacter]|uniref:Helix-turn-helix domain-containing protein n=1 Tax=Empedobacter falsenii TaxID=343874 RepID=A0AAW7DJ89_9FLAO|nr:MULTISPECIES: helix-turn-helix domain-containing protein [Empedobacter]MCA4809588.1 helix-turn-helix domain-containing protein [Empedobacter stercoris]MDM1551623.1 helix-turn-helix domain-containing protein [Empedobacter falsenii]QNT13512.1 helix-turn-helix domain-containing protein [Empedobacter stercoris]